MRIVCRCKDKRKTRNGKTGLFKVQIGLKYAYSRAFYNSICAAKTHKKKIPVPYIVLARGFKIQIKYVTYGKLMPYNVVKQQYPQSNQPPLKVLEYRLQPFKDVLYYVHNVIHHSVIFFKSSTSLPSVLYAFTAITTVKALPRSIFSSSIIHLIIIQYHPVSIVIDERALMSAISINVAANLEYP